MPVAARDRVQGDGVRDQSVAAVAETGHYMGLEADPPRCRSPAQSGVADGGRGSSASSAREWEKNWRDQAVAVVGAAAEIAVVVLIDEPGGGNLRAARQLPQFSALLVGERLVEREELVVLTLAHAYLAQCR